MRDILLTFIILSILAIGFKIDRIKERQQKFEHTICVNYLLTNTDIFTYTCVSTTNEYRYAFK